MSRTRRRTNRELILLHCGRKEDLDDWDRERFAGRDDDQVYAKRVHRFTGDTKSDIHSYPRWFRWVHWVKPTRIQNRMEIHRCLKNGSWDDHLTPRFGGDARHGYYW